MEGQDGYSQDSTWLPPPFPALSLIPHPEPHPQFQNPIPEPGCLRFPDPGSLPIQDQGPGATRAVGTPRSLSPAINYRHYYQY